VSLSAFSLNCTLKPWPETSSTQKLLDEVSRAMQRYGVQTTGARAVDHAIKAGVKADEGRGDEWPGLRKQILEADILVLGTPIWLGQPSSVAKRVLERMDAFLGEADPRGCYPTFGHVAVVVVVGNEDGAHHVTAELYQALADVGFTIPAVGTTYWVGKAMGSTNYLDLSATPDKVAAATGMLASNAAHLAALLAVEPYPGWNDAE
jgi:multimeric flavodoxin WrbA